MADRKNESDQYQRFTIGELALALTGEEGDALMLYARNLDRPPEYAISVSGAWTDWRSRRYEGVTMVGCMRLALAEKMRAEAERDREDPQASGPGPPAYLPETDAERELAQARASARAAKEWIAEIYEMVKLVASAGPGADPQASIDAVRCASAALPRALSLISAILPSEGEGGERGGGGGGSESLSEASLSSGPPSVETLCEIAAGVGYSVRIDSPFARHPFLVEFTSQPWTESSGKFDLTVSADTLPEALLAGKHLMEEIRCDQIIAGCASRPETPSEEKEPVEGGEGASDE